MTPAEAVAIIHPGDSIIWPLPEDTTEERMATFGDALRAVFEPLGVRAGIAATPATAIVIVRGFDAGTPIYDEMAAGR